MKHLQDLPVLVLGLGASGLAMARWCARHGARVTVADTREAPPQLPALQAELPDVAFVHGPFSDTLVQGGAVRAVYLSPGLAPEQTAVVVDAARAIGLPVGGELDLFAMALADLRGPDIEETPPLPIDLSAPDEDDNEPAAAAPAQESEPLPEDAPAIEPEAPAEEAAAVPRYRPAVLAITGTNGKTTVTSLTGQLVERAGKTVAVAGNIGPTLLDTLAERMAAGTLPQVWVLELSSFQLDAVRQFEPTAATVLNISQDHLDWHGGMAQYTAAKARVFGERGLMVLNREDEAVMAMLPPPVKVRLQKPQHRAHVTFGGDMPKRPGDYGIEVLNGMTWLVRATEADETRRKRGSEAEELHIQRLMPADALRIRGRHNAVNALAALALAQAAGCSLAPMLYGLREYRGEPHRVESVAVIEGVEYFDDSKGTNVGATVAALNGLGAERRIVVILGGVGKDQDFSPLAAPVARHARAVVLIGRDGPLIGAALAEAGVALHQAETLPEAVAAAGRLAHAGDAVLLSPACASFDMFRGYDHRAEVFCEAVAELAESQLSGSTEGGLE
ncbi:UDP-N-acetylmuramoyl-L-alanine--D-glutamate ligase [Xylophilus rhododendri]|uniref:UDP-N-acetylmuramoylalanine--D-glutamate ligase n=1 Tax=Xylophilus rhododendri TaxID=2697032 RepID=A0A857J7C0_9BURK|nr:UDP-N-acetylmuramoyl-L-alanine--D-glutamate ligase [Xylophilus rhododendri]QHI99746.1 UDP-N-acetylmuramoyl-L-alanine--D-glutamate ligase [Xylophilus rhododendri]